MVLIKLANHHFDLIWRPDVVLIRKKYDVSRAERNSFLEVFYGAEVLFIYENAHGKRGSSSKLIQRRDCLILRAVIANDHFVRRVSLIEVAFKLRRQIIRPVVCA